MYGNHAFQTSGRVEEEEEFTVSSVRTRRWTRDYVQVAVEAVQDV